MEAIAIYICAIVTMVLSFSFWIASLVQKRKEAKQKRHKHRTFFEMP